MADAIFAHLLSQEEKNNAEFMEILLSSYQCFEFDPFETTELVRLILWIQKESNFETYLKCIGSVCCSIDSNAYFTSYLSVSKALRTLMLRFCEAWYLFDSQMHSIVVVESDEAISDIFAAEESGQVGVFAATQSRLHEHSVGTAKAWLLHCLLNGFQHPMTRENILMFGVIERYVPGDPIDSRASAFQEMPKKPRDMDILYRSLLIPFLIDNTIITYDEVIFIEQTFSIPDDRCFSQFLLDDLMFIEQYDDDIHGPIVNANNALLDIENNIENDVELQNDVQEDNDSVDTLLMSQID